MVAGSSPALPTILKEGFKMSEWVKIKPKFCQGDTVIAITVDGTSLRYGKKYKIRKPDIDDIPLGIGSEEDYVSLEGISGGWYPYRFKLDTDGLPEVPSKEKEAGKPRRRMLRI